jgi:signal transduction histidine kinase
MNLPLPSDGDPSRVERVRGQTEPSADAQRSIDSALVTERLAQRPARPPDYAAEARALHEVAKALGMSPRAALDSLVRAALSFHDPRAATAGVSLLEDADEPGAQIFRWTALAGVLSGHVGGSTPREFSPCGVCLDHMAPVLFHRPDHCFPYFLESGIPFVEGLVVPFTVRGAAAGTIWVVTHDESRPFDREDVRVMTSLAEFTGAIYTVLDARESAEQARDDREWLLRAVSHEWRTPLGAITSMATLLADGVAGPVSSDQQALLHRMRAASEHLLALVDKTVAHASRQASAPAGGTSDAGSPGRVRAPATSDLVQIAQECMAMVEAPAREAGLELRCESASPTLSVHGDATMVRQILINLLGNAIKFTPQGRIELAVHARGRMGAVTVTDTGPGVSQADLERIFERYWSGDGIARRNHRGAGMGLAISRELARELGGDLTVASMPDHGATFTLILPLE